MNGGNGFSGFTAMNSRLKVFSSISDAQESQREIDINSFLESLLKEYNNRNVEAIRTHLEEIRKVLGNQIDGLEEIIFGGSIAKKTFIEGTSDVDALVFLNQSVYKDTPPSDLQNIFLKMLKVRFPSTQITKGTLAVSVKFSDYEVQILPALRDNGKIRIADRKSDRWSSPINAAAFSTRLTTTNKNNDNKVVPVIKLVKRFLGSLPEHHQLSGYHVEALAVDAFTAYNGRYTLYNMTKHCLEHSATRILKPMPDITGQSNIIDDYLGSAHSSIRQSISLQIKDITKTFSTSDISTIINKLIN